MIDETQLATPLHNLYCQLTGGSEPLTIYRILAWSAWSKENTQEDLRLVVNWIKGEIKAGRKWPTALTFRRLVEDLEGWHEALSMARSQARAPKFTPRDRVLSQSGRPPETTYKVTPAGEAAFRELQKLKESL